MKKNTLKLLLTASILTAIPLTAPIITSCNSNSSDVTDKKIVTSSVTSDAPYVFIEFGKTSFTKVQFNYQFKNAEDQVVDSKARWELIRNQEQLNSPLELYLDDTGMLWIDISKISKSVDMSGYEKVRIVAQPEDDPLKVPGYLDFYVLFSQKDGNFVIYKNWFFNLEDNFDLSLLCRENLGETKTIVLPTKGSQAMQKIEITPNDYNVVYGFVLHSIGSAQTTIGQNFISSFNYLEFLDLSGLKNIKEVGINFVNDNGRLKHIDFGETKLETIGKGFLDGCLSLNKFNFDVLEKLEDIPEQFMNYTNFTKIDLSPLVNVKTIGIAFLAECHSLIELDMSNMYSLESIGRYFLDLSESISKLYVPLSSRRVTLFDVSTHQSNWGFATALDAQEGEFKIICINKKRKELYESDIDGWNNPKGRPENIAFVISD